MLKTSAFSGLFLQQEMDCLDVRSFSLALSHFGWSRAIGLGLALLVVLSLSGITVQQQAALDSAATTSSSVPDFG